MTLPQGLYDRLINEHEIESLDAVAAAFGALIDKPSRAQQRELLIDMLTARLPELLDIVANAATGNVEQTRAELQLIAHLLREARKLSGDDSIDPVLAEPLRVLRALHAPNIVPILPQTGLRQPWIFTSARTDPSLLNELRAELSSVDRVDILVSFITWSGVR